MHDSLGDRIKKFYEQPYRMVLPRRTYTIIRVDGKAFHTYASKFVKPFDNDFVTDMNQTALALCENIQGALWGFVHSDEISVVLADFKKFDTSAWYDGNIQKMCSISASLATSYFNKFRIERHFITNGANLEGYRKFPVAQFDSRVFTIPQRDEVLNYFVWRQQDATRNSISAVARALCSHKEVDGKNVNEMQELIHQKGQNWNDYDDGLKRGRTIMRRSFVEQIKHGADAEPTPTEVNRWVIEKPPIFTQDRGYLGAVLDDLDASMQR